VSLATRPASPLRVAGLGCSDALDEGVWSLLSQDLQEARPVEQAEAVDQAGGAVAEYGRSVHGISGNGVGQGVLGSGGIGAGDPEAVRMVAVAALAEHLEEFAVLEPDGLVFPSGRGTYLQRSNFSRLVWRPAVKQLGLEGLRFHDLRHTAATLAAAAGATTRELMERMGHTSPAVALRYQHVMADRQGAIAAALDGLARDAEKKDRRRPRARKGHDGPRRGSDKRAAER
jgi:hypothetical protein